MTLSSLGENYRALVFGSTGGIGGAMVAALSDDPRCGAIFAAARRPPGSNDPKTTPVSFDLADESSIAAAAANAARDGPLDLVIVATGVLHDGDLTPEKSFRALDAAQLGRAYATNAIGPAMIAKHCLPLLAKGQKSAFVALSARVGSIEDNRLGGWHAYRMSKAALNMLVKTLSVEMASRNRDAIIAALHPGTVDTPLSTPFQRGVAAEKLFAPAFAAGRLLSVVDALTPAESGGFFAWDGARIPF
jgi:NAD(P)-dependent dehydrogenase (short-subunit alcohol dehydrogenase family)